MKRVLIALISFCIFLIEVIIQIMFLLINTIKTIPKIILLCLIRYHNRIQWLTSKNQIFIIKEIYNANV